MSHSATLARVPSVLQPPSRKVYAVLSSVLALGGCGPGGAVATARPPAAPTAAGMHAAPSPVAAPAAGGASTAADDVHRQALFVRVGQGTVPAIVRDVRQIGARAGTSTLLFRALPLDFDGRGVALRALRGRLDVVDVRTSGSLTAEALLRSHVGKRVRVQRQDTDGGPWEEGTLVGVAPPRALVAVSGEVSLVLYEHVALTGAPADATLETTATTDAGTVDVELTYATTQVRSAVGYRLVRSAGTGKGALAGEATITNDTGIDLPNAAFTLTADAPALGDFAQTNAAAKTAVPPSSDTTTIRFASLLSIPSGRAVSTRLFGPSEVALTRRTVIEGPGLPIYGGTQAGEMPSTSVRAVVDAVSVAGGKLSPPGMLPGTTELFEGDAQSSEPPRWYGSTVSRPLPGAVGLRTDLGDERQFETQRRLLAIKGLGRCVSESSWEVSITNPTEEPIPFEDVEPVTGDYTVLESSLPATAKEKDYFGFGFPVAGKTTVRLKFRVRVTSCVEVGRRGGYWYTGKSWGKPGSTPGS
jgi:hypothetical protein